MFRNQYDNDVTTWSPQGRIHQIEYAMEAVKQGSSTVGLKSKDFAVLVALKRSQSSLIGHQKKIEKVAKHVLTSISGLTSDARSLGKYIRSECLTHGFMYTSDIPVIRIVKSLANKLQVPTQRYGRRPFGVGILVAGFDEHGAHIFQTCPSANFYNCKSMAIGARSQSAKTFLEKNMDEISNADRNSLIRYGLLALRETLTSEQELTSDNCSIAIVGKNQDAVVFEDKEVAQFIEVMEKSAPKPPVTAQGGDVPGMVPAVSGDPRDNRTADEEEPMEM